MDKNNKKKIKALNKEIYNCRCMPYLRGKDYCKKCNENLEEINKLKKYKMKKIIKKIIIKRK